MARPRSLQRRATAPQLHDLIPRPMLFADEDPADFEELRDAFLAELVPGTPYERALVEDIVTLAWEAIRHRRMRDNLIRSRAKSIAARVFAGGAPANGCSSSVQYRQLASALVGPDSEEAAIALEVLEEWGFSLSEIFADAYRTLAGDVERHERKLAELETRRRRLREEYDRLRSARTRAPVEDAEIVG